MTCLNGSCSLNNGFFYRVNPQRKLYFQDSILIRKMAYTAVSKWQSRLTSALEQSKQWIIIIDWKLLLEQENWFFIVYKEKRRHDILQYNSWKPINFEYLRWNLKHFSLCFNYYINICCFLCISVAENRMLLKTKQPKTGFSSSKYLRETWPPLFIDFFCMRW